MKKWSFILFILLFILNFLELNGQRASWDLIQRSASVIHTDLCMLPDGLHGYSIGNCGTHGTPLTGFFFTTDGGVTWNDMNFPYTTTSVMNGVVFVNPDTGWVFGKNGKIYKTTDGGVTWINQSSGVSRMLNRGFFLNENEGWIVGGNSDGAQWLVLHTTNGGATWQNQSFGSDAYALNTVFFKDALNGWMGGTDNMIYPRMYHTTDGGTTWQQQTIPVSAQGTQIETLEFATLTKGWATVNSLYESPMGPVLYTQDGGNTWTIQYNTNNAYNFLDVKSETEIAIISVTMWPTTSESLFISGDGGQTYTAHTAPIIEYSLGIQYIDNKIWIAANKSIILSYSTENNTWKWEHYSPALRSIVWKNENTGWAIAGSYVGTDHYALKTTDGGVSWAPDSVAPGGACGQFVDENHGWMLYEGNSSKVWNTTDGGNTWSQHYMGTSNWIGGIFFATPDSGWAFGSNGSLRFTKNAGASWSSQNAGSSDYIESVFFINSQEGWAGGGYGGGYGFISHTVNGGASWALQTLPTNDHISSIFFLDKNHGWAGTMGGRVYLTADGGNIWTEGGMVPGGTLDELLMVDMNSGWTILYDGNALISSLYKTDDGGLSWSPEWIGDWPNAYLMDLSLQPDYHLWSCGEHNTIMEYSDIVSVPRTSAGTREKVSVIPNPASECTTIHYSLKFNSHVRISVYDAWGQVVSILSDNNQASGDHEINWDLTASSGIHVAPGLYFLELQENERLHEAKIMVN
jgi:photosystem II stability/assembly factor-like uncharacterized protein